MSEVEAVGDVLTMEALAGVFPDRMLTGCVLEGRIEVMTVDKDNRSEHWGLGVVYLLPGHTFPPHSSAAMWVSPPWSYQLWKLNTRATSVSLSPQNLPAFQWAEVECSGPMDRQMNLC